MAHLRPTFGSTNAKTADVPPRTPEPVDVQTEPARGPRNIRLFSRVVTHAERLLERRNRLTS